MEPTRDDIQRAHDRLVAIVVGEVYGSLTAWNPVERQAMMEAASVLCWVLGHEHNPTFAQNLRKIDEWMKVNGIVEVDVGTPIPRRKV